MARTTQAEIDRPKAPTKPVLVAGRAGIASSLYREPIGQRLRGERQKQEQEELWAKKRQS